MPDRISNTLFYIIQEKYHILKALSIIFVIFILSKAVKYQKRIGSFNENLLHHMSPLGWEHINLLGEYHFNSEKVVQVGGRHLRVSFLYFQKDLLHS
ncbi:Tn3 family transposase [Bacillus mycoides]|nr:MULTISPECIES: transposase [Bacillus cereus group]MED1265466.1 Tn3 family transposase [Bacillus mycoides]